MILQRPVSSTAIWRRGRCLEISPAKKITRLRPSGKSSGVRVPGGGGPRGGLPRSGGRRGRNVLAKSRRTVIEVGADPQGAVAAFPHADDAVAQPRDGFTRREIDQRPWIGRRFGSHGIVLVEENLERGDCRRAGTGGLACSEFEVGDLYARVIFRVRPNERLQV
jgi:hypothetical protein